MTTERQLITADELAERLSLSVETIWRYTRDKRIPFVKVGARQYRYDLNSVLQSMKRWGDGVQEESEEYKSATTFTYEDYLKLPDEPGIRYEVIEGMLIKDPSPVVYHQRVSARLQAALREYFQRVDPDGEMFYAPLDVVLSETTVVQPDLLYIPGNQKEILEQKYIFAAPHLIVEILSPATGKKDRVKKMEVYCKAGVAHYWLVDPDARILEAFALRGANYVRIAGGCEEDVFTHPNFPELEIPLGDIFPG